MRHFLLMLLLTFTSVQANSFNTAKSVRFEDPNPAGVRVWRHVQYGQNALFVQGEKGCLTIYWELDEPGPSYTIEPWGINITAPENHALQVATDRYGNPAVCREDSGLKWYFDIPGSNGQWGFICMPDPGNWCNTAKETKTDMPAGNSSVDAKTGCN